MAALTELDLSDNGLKIVPNEISAMKKLLWLDLRNNRLKKLPESIAQLADNLQELFLEGNPLSNEEKIRIRQWLPKTSVYFY